MRDRPLSEEFLFEIEHEQVLRFLLLHIQLGVLTYLISSLLLATFCSVWSLLRTDGFTQNVGLCKVLGDTGALCSIRDE